MKYTHPTAVIDEGATIGEGTKIWHFCHIMPSASIGKSCIIGQNVYIGSRVKVGDRVKIQNNVSLFEGVEIENEVFIGPSVVFTNVLNPRAFIDRKKEFKPTLVERGVSIGANATILCGLKIGCYALIGAGSVVTKDVRPYEIVVGNPARHHGWISQLGNKMFEDHSNEFIDLDGTKYELIDDQVKKMDKSLDNSGKIYPN